MKSLLRIFILVVIIGAHPYLFAEDYHLIWLDKTISIDEILEFSKLSENDMVQTLRTKYNVHVLSYRDPHGPRLQRLTIENLKEDQEFLEPFKKFLFDNREEVLGAYLPPFYSCQCQDNTLLRPYWDKPVILIKEKEIVFDKDESIPLRIVILHEFIHHYLHLLFSGPPIEKEGKKYSLKLDKQIRQRTLEKQLEVLQHKDSKEALILSAQIKLLKLQVLEDLEEEEIDIYRLFYDYRNELRLTLAEIKSQFLHVGSYSRKIDSILSPIQEQLEEERKLCNYAELVFLWEEIEDRLDSLSHKGGDTGRWLIDQDILMVRHPELFPDK